MPKELSAPICELLCSLTQPPAELHKCRTIHEAVRVSRRLRWVRKIHRLSAVSTWTTCTLVANDKCRKHLTRLITNEVDGERWVMHITSAVRPVMEELDRLDANRSTRTTKDRTRSFLQHRDAAVRALEKARTHLAAINCEPSIKELIDHPDYGLLQDAVAELVDEQYHRHQVRIELARRQLVEEGVPVKHQWAELINRGVYFQEGPVPHLDFLLQQAISFANETGAPGVDRHAVQGQFLRALYTELEGTGIGAVRIAFLCHATKALFGQEVDKAQVRRLVKDIAEETAARNAWLEELGFGNQGLESVLQHVKGDLPLHAGDSSQSLPRLNSSRETFKQSRKVSGRSEKVQNESTSPHPVRRSTRPSTAGKSSASARSSSSHRKKS